MVSVGYLEDNSRIPTETLSETPKIHCETISGRILDTQQTRLLFELEDLLLELEDLNKNN